MKDITKISVVLVVATALGCLNGPGGRLAEKRYHYDEKQSRSKGAENLAPSPGFG
jgi:hypothetical protein